MFGGREWQGLFPGKGTRCEKGSGCLLVLAVGHGRSLLTDMYDAHLTKVWWSKDTV